MKSKKEEISITNVRHNQLKIVAPYKSSLLLYFMLTYQF